MHHNQDSESCVLKTHLGFLMGYEHAGPSLGHTQVPVTQFTFTQPKLESFFCIITSQIFFWVFTSACYISLQPGQDGQTLREATCAARLPQTGSVLFFSSCVKSFYFQAILERVLEKIHTHLFYLMPQFQFRVLWELSCDCQCSYMVCFELQCCCVCFSSV